MKVNKQPPIYTDSDTSEAIPIDVFIDTNNRAWYNIENEDIYDNDTKPKRTNLTDYVHFNSGQST